MNYRESMLVWRDSKGRDHKFSAFKVKYMSGDDRATDVMVEPVEQPGVLVRFTVERPFAELNALVDQALEAGE